MCACALSLDDTTLQEKLSGEGVVSMNNVILAKWRIALSIKVAPYPVFSRSTTLDSKLIDFFVFLKY